MTQPKVGKELWQKEAQRIGGESFVQIMEDILASQRKTEVFEEETKEELIKLNKAFPAGDVDGHRRYHETMIEILAEKRRLRHAIQEKTIVGLVWVTIAAAAGMAWHEVQSVIGLVVDSKKSGIEVSK